MAGPPFLPDPAPVRLRTPLEGSRALALRWHGGIDAPPVEPAAHPQQDMSVEDTRTPITVITGYLGSGKTTLVNYVLKEQTDMRICVIENEVGCGPPPAPAGCPPPPAAHRLPPAAREGLPESGARNRPVLTAPGPPAPPAHRSSERLRSTVPSWGRTSRSRRT